MAVFSAFFEFNLLGCSVLSLGIYTNINNKNREIEALSYYDKLNYCKQFSSLPYNHYFLSGW